MKLLLGFIMGAMILAIVVGLYCALIIAGRADENDINGKNNERDHDMQICPGCKIGKESFELDKHSDACPYICCCKNGKCSFYEPL